MAISPQYRTLFKFDKSIIKRNWKNINESPLKRAGLLARRIERGLIRKDTTKAQNPSKPGRPPKSHHPSDIFRRIFSVPSNFDTNVIIGHMGLYGGETAMEIQEFGKEVQIRSKVVAPNRRRVGNVQARRRIRDMFLSGRLKAKKARYTTKTVKMPERPFARPTLERTKKRLPNLWANSVNSSTVRSA